MATPNIGALQAAVTLWSERGADLQLEAEAGNIIPDNTWEGARNIKFFVRHSDGSSLRVDHHPENEEASWLVVIDLDGQILARETTSMEDCFTGLPSLIEQLSR